MKIIINGTEGSGKTTIVNMISKRLGIPAFSGGDMRREIARKRGISIMELNRLGEKESWTDKDVDNKLLDIVKNKKDFVISSRTLPFLVNDKDIINIFLDADLDVRAQRIFALKREEEYFNTVEDVKKELIERAREDAKRYKKVYGIDVNDRSVYDFSFNTTDKTSGQTLNEILERIKQKI